MFGCPKDRIGNRSELYELHLHRRRHRHGPAIFFAPSRLLFALPSSEKTVPRGPLPPLLSSRCPSLWSWRSCISRGGIEGGTWLTDGKEKGGITWLGGGGEEALGSPAEGRKGTMLSLPAEGMIRGRRSARQQRRGKGRRLAHKRRGRSSIVEGRRAAEEEGHGRRRRGAPLWKKGAMAACKRTGVAERREGKRGNGDILGCCGSKRYAPGRGGGQFRPIRRGRPPNRGWACAEAGEYPRHSSPIPATNTEAIQTTELKATQCHFTIPALNIYFQTEAYMHRSQ